MAVALLRVEGRLIDHGAHQRKGLTQWLSELKRPRCWLQAAVASDQQRIVEDGP